MEYIRICGGRPLMGEVQVQSSKNAALPIMAAVLLSKGTFVLEKCPKITDVYHMAAIMEGLGCRIWWEEDTLCIDTKELTDFNICCREALCMRSSCLFLGSLLGRTGEAWLPYPGGCVIGKRPIDMHMDSLRQLGVIFEEDGKAIHAKVQKLKGCSIHLPYPSVGATENLMMAAVLAEGRTQIHGCAREPEVEELGRFLNAMGARIQWQNPDILLIDGVSSLHPLTYRMIPDRIVAGTYLLAAAAVRGRITLKGAPVEQLEALEHVLLRMGGSIRTSGTDLLFDGTKAVHGLDYVKTLPYPGFPTDLQPQLAAALACADSESIIEETVFESRFAAVREMSHMNASFLIEDRKIIITPVRRLKGARVHAGDLRGAAALVCAGLAAEGITEVEGCSYLERGYQDIVHDFTALGGVLEKVTQ